MASLRAGVGRVRTLWRGLVLAGLVCGGGAALAPVASAQLTWSNTKSLNIVSPSPSIRPVVCASTTTCMTFYYSPSSGAWDEVATFDPHGSGIGTPSPIDDEFGSTLGGVNGRNFPAVITSAACGSATVCVAVDNIGYEFTFNPRSPANPPAVSLLPTDLDGIGPSFGYGLVACPSATQCTLARGAEEVTFNPQAPAASATSATIDQYAAASQQQDSIGGLGCPTVTQCTVVDGYGYSITFNPRSPSEPSAPAIDSALIALACPTDGQCTALDTLGRYITFNPRSIGSPFSTTVAGSLTAIACPSKLDCVAIGLNATVEGKPTNGTRWATETIPGAGSLDSVTCPSVTECVTIDSNGDSSLGTQPAPKAATARAHSRRSARLRHRRPKRHGRVNRHAMHG